MNEGVSCGAVSVGEYNRVIYYYQESWQRKLATVKSLKADVDTVEIKSTDLKEKYFALEFCGFPNNLDIGKGHKLPYAAKNN